MSDECKVVSVNISTHRGTPKQPIAEAMINEHGVVGDSHAANWHRQVSVLAMEAIERFASEFGTQFKPGDFAENITTRGIDIDRVAFLDRLKINDVELEVSQIGKKCHGDGCAIFQEVGRCVMPQQGIFCRVIHGGSIRPGDTIRYIPRPLKIKVITLSDRASRGEYEDRSGPAIRNQLEAFFKDKRWHPQIDAAIIPDDAAVLENELSDARDDGADIIITTGGTGIGPKDITPEVVAAFCDKLIPGIMENIRVKYGSEKPNALLSRSIAGTVGTCQVYALPGSVKAVNEYMNEILKTLEHIIYMMHDVDVHG